MDDREHHRLAQAAGNCGFTFAPDAIRGEHHWSSHRRAIEAGVPPEEYRAWLDGQPWGPPVHYDRPVAAPSPPVVPPIKLKPAIPYIAAPPPRPEVDEETLRLLSAEQAAIDLGPPNRGKRVRGEWVASMEVEYMPAQWSQTYSVDFYPRAGTWTVGDIRSSGDGAGRMDTTFKSLEAAVSFVAGAVEEHEGRVEELVFRDVDSEDRVDLRRFVYRLRAVLGQA